MDHHHQHHNQQVNAQQGVQQLQRQPVRGKGHSLVLAKMPVDKHRGTQQNRIGLSRTGTGADLWVGPKRKQLGLERQYMLLHQQYSLQMVNHNTAGQASQAGTTALSLSTTVMIHLHQKQRLAEGSHLGTYTMNSLGITSYPPPARQMLGQRGMEGRGKNQQQNQLEVCLKTVQPVVLVLVAPAAAAVHGGVVIQGLMASVSQKVLYYSRPW
jgi:hypothetical protein